MSRRHTTFARPLTTALLAVTLLGAWGGKLNPTTWGPLPEFFVLAFPLTVAVAFLAMAMALARKSFVNALLLACGIVASVPMLTVTFPMPSCSRATVPACDNPATLKVMSFNVHGFNAEDHRVKNRPNITLEAILQADADIVAMQEAVYWGWNYADVPSVKPLLDSIARKYPYRTDSRSDKVTLFSKYPFTTSALVHNRVKDSYGKPFTRTDACAHHVTLPGGKSITLVNAYLASYMLNRQERSLLTVASSRDVDTVSLYSKFAGALVARANQTRQITAFLKNRPGNIVMCCDMNDVPGSYCYRLLTDSLLNDSYADCGKGYLYTYNSNHYYFHLDHILYRGHMKPVRFERPRAGISDHYPIVATFVVE